MHQTAQNFKNFLRELAYAREPPSIHATIINMYFYLKIVIFYSRLFQNTQQNASVVKRFQTFL